MQLLKPGRETVSMLHWPKNDIPTFFKFQLKKVSRLHKRNFLHLLNECRCLATSLLQITTPKVVKKCAGALWSCQKTFFSRNLRNGRMSFLGLCNVETVSHLGFQDLSCSNVAGFEGSFFQKLFKGYIFCFLGHLVGRYIFELSARETNLIKFIYSEKATKFCEIFTLLMSYRARTAVAVFVQSASQM